MMQEWFQKARLGIFIHYGIYAVDGTSESWAFKNHEVPYKKYMSQLSGFTAKNYDPEAWAKLFHKAGARYAVLTAKHHDGVALFDTKYSDLSVVKKTPAGRDLLRPYCEALRKEGLKVGVYFTQLDWSHPCYTSLQWKPGRMRLDQVFGKNKKWEKFKEFHRNQLAEILTEYGPVDLLWFDGDWERSQADWGMKEMKEFITKTSPQTVVNSRIGSYGDYDTPEQQMPIQKPEGPWEYCMTVNDSWGYRPKDNNYKTAYEILRIFCEIITMGGNLLLDLGPKEDGTFDPRGEALLERLGEFNKKNEAAVFFSRCIENPYYPGGAMASEDGNTLYFFEYGAPAELLYARHIRRPVKEIRNAQGKPLKFLQKDGWLWIESFSAEQGEISILTVDLEEPDAAEEAYPTVDGGLKIEADSCEEEYQTVVSSIENGACPKPGSLRLNNWADRNQNAFCPGNTQLPEELYCGRGAVSPDKKTLYLFCTSRPGESLMVKGIKNKFESITVLGTGQQLPYKVNGRMLHNGMPGTLWIDTKELRPDEMVTVIEICLKGELDLYKGTGAPITQN